MKIFDYTKLALTKSGKLVAKSHALIIPSPINSTNCPVVHLNNLGEQKPSDGQEYTVLGGAKKVPIMMKEGSFYCKAGTFEGDKAFLGVRIYLGSSDMSTNVLYKDIPYSEGVLDDNGNLVFTYDYPVFETGRMHAYFHATYNSDSGEGEQFIQNAYMTVRHINVKAGKDPVPPEPGPEPEPEDSIIIGGKSYKVKEFNGIKIMTEDLAYDDGLGGIYIENGIYYYSYEAAKRIADSIDGWDLPIKTDFEVLFNRPGKLVAQDGWTDYEYWTPYYGGNEETIAKLNEFLSEDSFNFKLYGEYWNNADKADYIDKIGHLWTNDILISDWSTSTDHAYFQYGSYHDANTQFILLSDYNNENEYKYNVRFVKR